MPNAEELSSIVCKFNYTYKEKNFKSTIPLTLAYAITGHKIQGGKIAAKAVIDICEAFTSGLTYILLSRVTKKNMLCYQGSSLYIDDFNPVKCIVQYNKD